MALGAVPNPTGEPALTFVDPSRRVGHRHRILGHPRGPADYTTVVEVQPALDFLERVLD